MMYKVISKPACPWCDKAKTLLRIKNLPYTEVELSLGQPLLEAKSYMELYEFQDLCPNAKTVPQIFDGETLIGGYAELVKYLEEKA
jgi:glutaredoxin 3